MPKGLATMTVPENVVQEIPEDINQPSNIERQVILYLQKKIPK